MSGSKVVDATDADAEVEALERKIPGVLFPLGCTSSRLSSFLFTFFLCF